MLGLKHLSINRLAVSLLAVSAALMVFAFAAPEGGSITGLLAWIVGALVLLGLWTVVALEVFKRRFGAGGGRGDER